MARPDHHHHHRRRGLVLTLDLDVLVSWAIASLQIVAGAWQVVSGFSEMLHHARAHDRRELRRNGQH